MKQDAPFTVVIPAFNEEAGIQPVIHSLREALDGYDYQLLVVDDGSEDQTAELAFEAGAEVLSQPVNRGYGASLKTGISKASHDRIVIIDADGTYPVTAIPGLVAGLDEYEMVVGARIGANTNVPFVRRPAKWVLRHLASYLAGRRIPDLNSGLRAMRRDLVARYTHLTWLRVTHTCCRPVFRLQQPLPSPPCAGITWSSTRPLITTRGWASRKSGLTMPLNS